MVQSYTWDQIQRGENLGTYDHNAASGYQQAARSPWMPAGYQSPTSYVATRQAPVNQEQQRVTQNVREGSDFMPYLNQLRDLMQNPSSIENNPAYQARIRAGEQAINRSAAARGMSGSGNVLAALAQYGGEQASQEYGNQVNQLSNLMSGAQQFGLTSDYIRTPQAPSRWVGGALVSPMPQASWY